MTSTLPFSAALFAAGVLIALALTVAQVRFSWFLRITSAPRNDRWHRNPTPSSGGIAIFAAAAILYLAWFRGEQSSIAIGAAALWLLGLIDDRLRLRPSLKLLGQCAVCAGVVASGAVFNATASPLFNIAFSFMWLIGITNAFNLIDNMDGLCAGVTVVIALFRFCLLTWSGDSSGADLCLLIAAVYFGFLLLNYRPAKIFMGDCGSMFAGFSLAALTITSPIPHTKAFAAGIFYPALTFTYPIFDTALVSVLRRSAGRPISVGGRDHSSHRLVMLGLTEARVVWILWALTAVGSCVALLIQWMPISVFAAGGLLCVALSVFALFLATLPAYPVTPEIEARQPTSVRRHLPTLRSAIILLLDASVAGIALFSAFLLRFGPHMPAYQVRMLLIALPVVLAVHAAFSYRDRTYALLSSSFSLRDFVLLGRTVIIGAACSFALFTVIQPKTYSRGVLALYCVLCVFFLAGLRRSLPMLRPALDGERSAPSVDRAPVSVAALKANATSAAGS